MVVGVIGFAFIGKFPAGEQVVVLRKMKIDGGSQSGHVAGGGYLFAVGQAGSVFENRVFHAEGFGHFGHLFGKPGFAVAEAFRQNGGAVVGRFDDQGVNRGFHFDFAAGF